MRIFDCINGIRTHNHGLRRSNGDCCNASLVAVAVGLEPTMRSARTTRFQDELLIQPDNHHTYYLFKHLAISAANFIDNIPLIKKAVVIKI